MKDEIAQVFRESADLKLRFIRQNAEVVAQVVRMIVEAFKSGNKVLLFGNGGGAADAKQVKALGKEGDVAIGISTSGSAANVIKAIKVAAEMGLKTVALSGNDGGELAKISDIALIVDSPVTPRIQEVHITVGHVICEMVDRMLFQHPT
jgi:D-sedoheptulose 7-phosphate isomerase